MRKYKIITDFSDFKDADLDVEASNAVKGLTGNTYFTFTGTQLTNLTTNAAAYHTALGNLATGGKTAVTAKNAARKVLENSFGEVANIVNQQASGDLNKLQTTGITLQKQPVHQAQPLPVNFKVENGNNGAMNVSVDKSTVADYGTVFAYTPVTNAASDINLWTLKPVNGHSTIIKGLPAGVPYLFSAAYKGSDGDDLVWASPITKYVSN